jgi:hypothetical protein
LLGKLVDFLKLRFGGCETGESRFANVSLHSGVHQMGGRRLKERLRPLRGAFVLRALSVIER